MNRDEKLIFFQVEASLALTTTLDPDTPFTREPMESLSMRTPTKVSVKTILLGGKMVLTLLI